MYALIRDFGTFYCSLLEKCALVDGKRKMGPSYFPEIGKYDEFNVCYDISYVTAGLRIAREAATLKNDAALIKRIDSVIDQVPTYGTQPDPDQNGQTVIEPWLGAKFKVGADRHGTMVQGIFPAGNHQLVLQRRPESSRRSHHRPRGTMHHARQLQRHHQRLPRAARPGR